LRFRRVDEGAASIRDKIRFPVEETSLKFPLRGRHEIVGPAVEALVENVLATEHEWNVVQQIDHQRRAGNRQKQDRLTAAVNHPMGTIERNREQASLMPLELEFFLVIVCGPNLCGANAAQNINDFFVEVPFDIQSATGRNFA